MTAELAFVLADDDTDRLDRVLARRYPDASRRALSELFAEGAVKVDGRTAKKGDRARVGTTVSLARAPTAPDDMRALPDPAVAERLAILHCDDDLIVIAKPPGIPSQPLRAGELGTAASGLVALHPECARVADDPRDGGLAHRLDIGTSGVLVAARTRAAWLHLREAFSAGMIHKQYLALVESPPVSASCDHPLAQRGGRAVDDLGGLPAFTRWEVEQILGERRLLRCYATTGRMHQIRFHLATCGAPIVGDTLYGGHPHPGLIGFFLHAALIRLPRPRTGETLTVEAPLPPDRQAALTAAT